MYIYDYTYILVIKSDTCSPKNTANDRPNKVTQPLKKS